MKHLYKLVMKRKSFKNPASFFELSNIRGFIQGNWRALMQRFTNRFPPIHIQEQRIWRLGQVDQKSPACLKNDQCINCGCDMNKTWEDRGCDPCYPPMMTQVRWSQYKYRNQIHM